MLERVSALAGIVPFHGDGVQVFDIVTPTLTQVAGDAQALTTAFPKLPATVGVVVEYAGKSFLRVGPHQLWVIGAAPELQDGLFLAPLSSSRMCIAIEGPRARAVLAKCAAIDFHAQAFKPDRFVMTGVHHMPALIHCAAADRFHVYTLRTFALHMWEIFVDAAHS
jgi:heterotetrameric sarcosine oxidase gamma subunit